MGRALALIVVAVAVALLDSGRMASGHHFGSELSAVDREALVAFLQTL